MGSRGLEPLWLRLHAAHLAMLPCLSVCLSLPPEAGKVPEFSSQAGQCVRWTRSAGQEGQAGGHRGG